MGIRVRFESTLFDLFNKYVALCSISEICLTHLTKCYFTNLTFKTLSTYAYFLSFIPRPILITDYMNQS